MNEERQVSLKGLAAMSLERLLHYVLAGAGRRFA